VLVVVQPAPAERGVRDGFKRQGGRRAGFPPGVDLGRHLLGGSLASACRVRACRWAMSRLPTAPRREILREGDVRFRLLNQPT
jgi:hypothetical protein